MGQAFAFNAPTSNVRIAASPSLDVGAGDGMTVELWINPDDVTQPSPLVEWNNGIDLWGAHFWVFADQAGGGLQPPSSAVAGPGQLYAAFTLLGQWYQMVTDAGVLTPHVFQHVALTYDKSSGMGRIYRNGMVVAEQSLGAFTPQTAYDVYLGLRPAGPPGTAVVAYHGLMDEVSIYNRALTAAEIASIYNAGTAGKCSTPPALVENLIELVTAAPETVTKEPLLAILSAASASLARGNMRAAINQLSAFQNKVQARVGPLDAALATQLMALAQQIIESVDPTGARRAELDAMAGMPLRVQRLFELPLAAICVEARAIPGTLCRVERSTNLRDWVEAGVPAEVADGLYQFLDSRREGTGWFYRFKAP